MRDRLIIASLLLVPAIWGSSCGPVGPDHDVPAMELPASFSTGPVQWKRTSPETLPRPREWWRLFHDAELNRLVARTLSDNQDIKAANARLKQARASSAMARSRYFPSLELGVSGSRDKFRFRGPGGGSNILNAFEVPADLSYEIDLWGKIRRQVEGAAAAEDSAQELVHAQQLSMVAETAQTYWALRATDADRAVLARTLEIRNRAYGLLEKRHQAGTISGLDLSRAKSEIAAAEASRLQLDQTRGQLVHSLAVLCGTAMRDLSLKERNDLPDPPAIPVSVPSELLRQRPDVRAAERNVAAANAEIGVATAAFLPSFPIQAATGFDSLTMRDLFDARSLVWSLGANAITPLTNLRYLHAQRRAVIAAHEAASADYRQSVFEAVSEVETALIACRVLEQRHAVQTEAVAAARKTFDLSVKRFESGMISFLDVVDAERTRLDAESAANAIRAERLAMAVALAKALGGEW